MDIVEFAEKVLDLDLLDFQKKYLTALNKDYLKRIERMYVEPRREAVKLLEQELFDEIIDKTVKEIFAQCKQINPNYSKDWNEGFNDGMFHTITIINGIRKGEMQ